MKKDRDYSRTFEIGSDFTVEGLKRIIEDGIEQGKIFPVDLEKMIPSIPFLGYQFNIELKVGDKRRLITLEYQKVELPPKSGYYKKLYASVPVGTLDMTSEEVDNFGLDL